MGMVKEEKRSEELGISLVSEMKIPKTERGELSEWILGPDHLVLQTRVGKS